ncbi:MAG: hypothetical protein NT140_04220 [Deltaproteobacteria bacterium]|nr:hypothetical protein [Deltaproteobacteria bacterium]
MKKLILVVLAVFLMSGVASAATTMELKGSFRVYPEMTNMGYSPSGTIPDYLPGVGSLANQGLPTSGTGKPAVQNYWVEQRARLIFNVKSDENVGGTVHLEIDSRWGQTSYSSIAWRGAGGGLGADSTNLELKESFMWFQAGALRVKAGIQTWADDISGIFIGGGDMAGFRADYALSKTSSFATGVFTFWDPTQSKTDGVYFVPLTVKQQLGSGTASLFLYMIQDNSNYVPYYSQNTTNVAVINTAFPGYNDRGTRPLTTTDTSTAGTTLLKAAYESAQIYYAGLNYGGKAGNISYYLMGAYNFGNFKNARTYLVPDVLDRTDDVKISAFAANAKVDVKVGGGNLRGNLLYVQGGDSTSTDKYNGFIPGDMYAGAQSMPLYQTDLVILINNTDGITNSTFMVPTVNNNGDGVQLGYLAYDYNITPKLNAKAVAGYASADKQNLTTRKGKGMGAEYNAQLKYLFNANMTISGVASYAQIGDYFKTATFDADNAYKLLLRFIYAF